MRRVAEGRASTELVEELRELLLNFSKSLQSEDLRARVLRLVPAYAMLRSIGASLVPVSGSDAARERMLAYLLRYQKLVIHGDELLVVSGIGEWARRIRELRTQMGWPIVSGGTLKAMIKEQELEEAEFGGERILVDDYVILADSPDRDAAHRWYVANSIRRRRESVQDKILAFLQANVGRPVTGDELMYVAQNKTEWARRVRELRTEEGWAVVTRNTGRPDLSIGQYLLECGFRHNRPPVPVQFGHAFRLNAASQSGPFRPATSRVMESVC